MPQTITRLPALAAPIVPDIMERGSYSSSAEARNVIHPIVGRADVEATLKPAGLRTGSLTMVFRSRAAAFAAQAAHSGVGIFTLTDSAIPQASMSYVVVGTIGLVLPANASEWTLTVGYQEVLP